MSEVKTKEIKTKSAFEEKSDNVFSENADIGVHIINSPVIRFNGVLLITGKGSPLNVVNAPLGSMYLNQSGGANTTLYMKETETVVGDSTGWAAI